MVTRTAQGIPGDPINVGLIGDKLDVLCAMHAAGWYPADPVTLRSSIEIVGSVLLDRPYHAAPVSPLFYLGRREDLAFEKPVGDSADRRHHVRFWKVLDQGQEKRPVWLGVGDLRSRRRRQPLYRRHHPPYCRRYRRRPRSSGQGSRGRAHGRCQISGDRHRAHADRAQWRRRSLLHRWRSVDSAAGRRVPAKRPARRTSCQARPRPKSRIRSGMQWSMPHVELPCRIPSSEVAPPHDSLTPISSGHDLNFPRIPRHPFRLPYQSEGTTKMTVRAGREFLAIPGPTTMPDEVLQAMHRPALDIYSEQMVQLTDSLLRDLSRLFATKGNSYIYIANGHGAWEAAISNVLSRGDKMLVLESGRFASAGAMRRPRWAPTSKCSRATGAAPFGRQKSRRACGRTRTTRSRRSWRCRSIPPRAPVTTSKPSARRSSQPAIPRCSWSMPWRRWAACRSRWTPGASMSRCPARRRA